MKVLIVDDVPFLLTSLRQLLQRNGYEVVTALSGEIALEKLKADLGIGAVITDLAMPEMNGMQFFKHAQVIERFNDKGHVEVPKFILLTSFDDTNLGSPLAEDFHMAQYAFEAVVQKPVEADELLLVLQKIEHRTAMSGKEAALLRNILNSSLEDISQASGRDDVMNIVEQLQQRLSVFSEVLAKEHFSA